MNACVRNKADSKNKFLLDMARDIAKGKIELFSADLRTMGAYDDAVCNADAVIHAAAQVNTKITDPMKDMVEPSTDGVRNILSSVNKSKNVKHYVHTSSAAAVGPPFLGAQRSENDWSSVTLEKSPYEFAKTEAEKLVWSMTAGKSYTVSCINPTMVLGPCLSKPHTKASPYILRQALLGNLQANVPYECVDVRTVASAHLEAMLRPEANGKRFILSGDEPPLAINNIIQKCREMFPQYQFGDAPGSKGWDEKTFGKRPTQPFFVNTRSKKALGSTYIGLDQSIMETVESMVKGEFVPARPVSKL